MLEFTIRPAVPADAAVIADIEKVTFPLPWSETAILAEIEKAYAVFFVCETGGEIAGYVSMETVCDEAYIGNLAVREHYRRSGLATALLRQLITEAIQKNCAFLTLEVRASNAAAIKLYQHNGFSMQGIRRGFYTDPVEDGLIFTLFLKEDEYENTCH